MHPNRNQKTKAQQQADDQARRRIYRQVELENAIALRKQQLHPETAPPTPQQVAQAEQAAKSKAEEDARKANLEINVREMLANDTTAATFTTADRVHVINRVLHARDDAMKSRTPFDFRLSFLQAVHAVKEQVAKRTGAPPPLAPAPKPTTLAEQWTAEAGKERQKQTEILQAQLRDGIPYVDANGVERRLRVGNPLAIPSAMAGTPGTFGR